MNKIKLCTLPEGAFFKIPANKKRFKLIRKNIDTCVCMDLLTSKLLVKDAKRDVVRIWQEL
jgi:hypothetical protein